MVEVHVEITLLYQRAGFRSELIQIEGVSNVPASLMLTNYKVTLKAKDDAEINAMINKIKELTAVNSVEKK